MCQQMDAYKKTAQRNSNDLPDDSAHKVSELRESLRNNPPRESNDVDRSADEFEGRNLDETNNSDNDDVNMNCDEDPPSPEFIPSSQTVNSDLNHVHFIKRSSTQGLCKTHPGCSSEISSDSESDVKEIESVNSETSKIKSPQLEGIKKGRSSQNLTNINSPLVESKKNRNFLTKTSPISSRTRLKDKPTDSSSLAPKTKTTDDVAKSFYFSLEREREIGHMPDNKKPQTLLNTEEEHSDHQLDDTQILEETTARNFVKVAPVIATIECKDQLDFDKIVKECETPSSPVASSSVKLVNSKNPSNVSPLCRPTRAFGSSAASPITGILKRNKGRVDTSSPPEK